MTTLITNQQRKQEALPSIDLNKTKKTNQQISKVCGVFVDKHNNPWNGSVCKEKGNVVENFHCVNGIPNGKAEEVNSRYKLFFEYKDGIRHGKAMLQNQDSLTEVFFTFVNGKVQGEAFQVNQSTVINFNFIDGRREGNAVFTKNDGTKQINFKYVKNIPEGPAQEITKLGITNFTFLNGKKNGTAWFKSHDGSKETQVNYSNSVLHGLAQEKYRYGLRKFVFVNGVKQGATISESIAGEIHRGTYVNGKMEGKAAIILPDLNTISCTYVNDVVNGKAIEQDEKGNRIEFIFVNGMRKGPATYYRSIDQTITHFEYPIKDHVYETEFFNENSSLRQRLTEIHNPRPRSKEEDDRPSIRPERTIISDHANRPANGFFACEYVSGNTIYLKCVDGIPQGEAQLVTSEKTIFFNYVDGIKHGPAVSKHHVGTCEMQMNYSNDVLEGPAVEITSEGLKRFTFANGVRQGPAVLELANGEMHRVTYVNDKIEGKAAIILPNLDVMCCTYVNDTPYRTPMEQDQQTLDSNNPPQQDFNNITTFNVDSFFNDDL